MKLGNLGLNGLKKENLWHGIIGRMY